MNMFEQYVECMSNRSVVQYKLGHGFINTFEQYIEFLWLEALISNHFCLLPIKNCSLIINTELIYER